MVYFRHIFLTGAAVVLTACAASPMGPMVRVLPAKDKPFEQFQVEHAACKQYAFEEVRGQAEVANTTGLVQGIATTALGAGLGTAIGGGQGAGIGAAGGAIAGSGIGASTSSQQQSGIQQQYDNAYIQCMAAKGNMLEQQVLCQPAPAVVSSPASPTVIYTSAPAVSVPAPATVSPPAP